YLTRAFFKHDVAGCAGHGIQGFDQGDAGSKHGGQRARKSCHHGFVENVPDNGQFEQPFVDATAEIVGSPERHDEYDDACDQAHDDEPPPLLDHIRQPDDYACECRQVGAEALEQGFKFRYHEIQQKAGDDECHYDDRARVEQCLAHFRLDAFVFFLVCRDLVEQRSEEHTS